MQRSALCRSRRKLSNAYLLAKFGFDTAENEPSKVCRSPPRVRPRTSPARPLAPSGPESALGGQTFRGGVRLPELREMHLPHNSRNFQTTKVFVKNVRGGLTEFCGCAFSDCFLYFQNIRFKNVWYVIQKVGFGGGSQC